MASEPSPRKNYIILNSETENFGDLHFLCSHPEIRDCKAVVLSNVGRCRTGKSFFLNYCLIYLYTHYPSLRNPNNTYQKTFQIHEDWMGLPNEPLKGFPWRSGSKSETKNIYVWNDVFFYKNETTGEKVAILVMDTPGFFESSKDNDLKIFTFASQISSIFVLNCKNQIHEDLFEFLHGTIEFSQFQARNCGKYDKQLFQKLNFNVKDWECYDEYPYGADGGQNYIEEILHPNDQNKKLHIAHEYVEKSCMKIRCFLLPYPGSKVAGRKDYDGRWSDIDEGSRIHLKRCIEQLLAPENLLLKRINDKEVTVAELYMYMKKLSNSLKESPTVPSAYRLMVDRELEMLKNKSVDCYMHCIDNDPALKESQSILNAHIEAKEKALKLYDEGLTIGDSNIQNLVREELIKQIDTIFLPNLNRNEMNSFILNDQTEQFDAHLEKQLEKKDKFKETDEDVVKNLEEISREIMHRKHNEAILDRKDEEFRVKHESFYENSLWVKSLRSFASGFTSSIMIPLESIRNLKRLSRNRPLNAGEFMDVPIPSRGTRN